MKYFKSRKKRRLLKRVRYVLVLVLMFMLYTLPSGDVLRSFRPCVSVCRYAAFHLWVRSDFSLWHTVRKSRITPDGGYSVVKVRSVFCV